MKLKQAYGFEPKWLLIFVFFLAGFFLGGIVLYIILGLNTGGLLKVHLNSPNYKYINPVLTVETSQKFFSINKSLELETGAIINKHKNLGNISSVAVYFRDIEPGYWFGINDADRFSPGKLLKLPIMIAYYKLAETNPDILDQKIIYKASNDGKEKLFPSRSNFKIGELYTAGELINNMIVNADDNSTMLLFDNIDKILLNEIFSDLGIDFKEDKRTNDFISLKLYSIFFRILYNSSYLNRDYSEKALALLVEADDDFGLAAGLPKNIVVANRYGARTYAEDDKKVVEMYDCNLVYYPKYPYLACSFARGGDLGNIQKFFTELGEKIYSEARYRYQ